MYSPSRPDPLPITSGRAGLYVRTRFSLHKVKIANLTQEALPMLPKMTEQEKKDGVTISHKLTVPKSFEEARHEYG